MAYIALYRKYRPQTFTDVVRSTSGVWYVDAYASARIRWLMRICSAGPRGTGKTSMAKIFRTRYQLRAWANGSSLYEWVLVNRFWAASLWMFLKLTLHPIVVSMRCVPFVKASNSCLLKAVKKVFIIDEAHMLTTEAWNALLKSIEEPPAHVMFTSLPQKLKNCPVTIVSRCQRYTFRRITSVWYRTAIILCSGKGKALA